MAKRHKRTTKKRKKKKMTKKRRSQKGGAYGLPYNVWDFRRDMMNFPKSKFLKNVGKVIKFFR